MKEENRKEKGTAIMHVHTQTYTHALEEEYEYDD
jgi:hypothetical protein